MPADRQPPVPHQAIQEIIDKSLAGAASPEEQQALRDHLAGCAPCREHLDISRRAIRGLSDFSFEISPGLDSKVLAAINRRAEQLEARQVRRKRLWITPLIALALTIGGAFAAKQFSALAAILFHIAPAQLQFGVLAFWITPSIFFCLLFLLLPISNTGGMNKKGLSQ
jgi:anti-sigma factor RsiW